jgi:hypothetical protein
MPNNWLLQLIPESQQKENLKILLREQHPIPTSVSSLFTELNTDEKKAVASFTRNFSILMFPGYNLNESISSIINSFQDELLKTRLIESLRTIYIYDTSNINYNILVPQSSHQRSQRYFPHRSTKVQRSANHSISVTSRLLPHSLSYLSPFHSLPSSHHYHHLHYRMNVENVKYQSEMIYCVSNWFVFYKLETIFPIKDIFKQLNIFYCKYGLIPVKFASEVACESIFFIGEAKCNSWDIFIPRVVIKNIASSVLHRLGCDIKAPNLQNKLKSSRYESGKKVYYNLLVSSKMRNICYVRLDETLMTFLSRTFNTA